MKEKLIVGAPLRRTYQDSQPDRLSQHSEVVRYLHLSSVEMEGDARLMEYFLPLGTIHFAEIK